MYHHIALHHPRAPLQRDWTRLTGRNASAARLGFSQFVWLAAFADSALTDVSPGCLTAPCGEACGGGTCPAERVWGRAEYLMWWMRGASVPPLVTTGPAVGAFPGALVPGTTVLFGGGQANTNFFSGGRFSAGVWLGECHKWGLEAGYMFLAPQTTSFAAISNGTPL